MYVHSPVAEYSQRLLAQIDKQLVYVGTNHFKKYPFRNDTINCLYQAHSIRTAQLEVIIVAVVFELVNNEKGNPPPRAYLFKALYPGTGQFKYDGTPAETTFRLSAKRTSPFKSAGGRQFSRLLAAEVCASAVVMLDTPCSDVA